MRRLSVFFSGWGLDYLLGTLAEGAGVLVFEFSPEARSHGFDLSPFFHPLDRTASISRSVRAPQPLPGFLDDALPDGWGRLLVDRALLDRQRIPAEVSPLERLAIVGDSAFGALRFAPAEPLVAQRDMDLLTLAREIDKVEAERPSAYLVEMLKAGSPQGARPKAAMWAAPPTGRLSTQRTTEAAPWLVKFRGRDDGPHAPAIESVYARLARQCGIDMPDTRWLPPAEVPGAAFAVARFDRQDGVRVPIQSFAALMELEPREYRAQDYLTLIRMVRELTRDEREATEFFRRCAFNVVFHNRDDHPRNFAARLGADRRWTLAPAFDLTYSDGPRGEHSVTVAGAGREVTREHLLRVGEAGGLRRPAAVAIVDRVLDAVPDFRPLAAACDVPANEIGQLEARIRHCAERCRG